GLLALDNVKPGQDPLTISTFAWPIAALLGLFLLAGLATHWRDFNATVMLAVSSALPPIATITIFLPGTTFLGPSFTIAAAAAFAGFAISRPTSHVSPIERSISASLIAVCIGAPLISAANTPKATLTRLLIGLALSISFGAIEQFILFRLRVPPASW